MGAIAGTLRVYCRERSSTFGLHHYCGRGSRESGLWAGCESSSPSSPLHQARRHFLRQQTIRAASPSLHFLTLDEAGNIATWHTPLRAVGQRRIIYGNDEISPWVRPAFHFYRKPWTRAVYNWTMHLL
ncbi:hypothetical protein AVEN_241994-1 [Araneus ventricosus]|uniref:Uncharacterized protein n=1 Tax=Araneus ventricosus TaxID=182803 RepID=A0A4Y2E9D0_ARAVE|nr:hypothetical protein AVEN_241994-1 [Araneus ventricosus]